MRKRKNKEAHNRGYMFRIYPNEEQRMLIKQSFGCRRFVYNFFLNRKIEVYRETNEMYNLSSCQSELQEMKQTDNFSWLKIVDKFVLANALLDLEAAFKNFFRERSKGNIKQGFPKFKKKGVCRFSYHTNFTNNNIKFLPEERKIQLPKIGLVPYKGYSKLTLLQGALKSAVISRSKSGKYFVSLLTEIEEPLPISSANGKAIGLDLGLTHFLIDSEGNKVDNPRYYRKAENRLVTLQKRLSRKQKGSKNRNKARSAVAKHHEYIANIRKDFLHKQSRRIVNENQVIVLEDLYVKGLIKNHKLAKSIQDVGWGYFKQFIAYKGLWGGKKIVFVDRFFPSSKLCSGCSKKNTLLSLNERQWVCPSCGAVHDRDINAAKNILAQGLSQLA